MFDGDVVFRTAPGEKLIAAVMGRTVVLRSTTSTCSAMTGWSVVVIGHAEEVVDRKELAWMREGRPPPAGG